MHSKKASSDSGEKRLKANYEKKLRKVKQMERNLKRNAAKQKRTLKVLEGILQEREELQKHHERKLIQLKRSYERKLREVNRREHKVHSKEKRMDNLERENKELLRSTDALARNFERLGREEKLVRREVKKHHAVLEQVQKEHARTHVEYTKLMKKLKGLHKQFDAAHSRVNEVTGMLREKNAELGSVRLKLEHAKAKHKEVTTQITHHSRKEIKACIRRAEEHLGKGQHLKAQREYERIRRFYAHLTQKEKKTVYPSVARIKDRLTYCF